MPSSGRTTAAKRALLLVGLLLGICEVHAATFVYDKEVVLAKGDELDFPHESAFTELLNSKTGFRLTVETSPSKEKRPHSHVPLWFGSNPTRKGHVGISVGHKVSKDAFEVRLGDGSQQSNYVFKHPRVFLDTKTERRIDVSTIADGGGRRVDFYLNGEFVESHEFTKITGDLYPDTKTGAHFGDVWDWKFAGTLHSIKLETFKATGPPPAPPAKLKTPPPPPPKPKPSSAPTTSDKRKAKVGGNRPSKPSIVDKTKDRLARLPKTGSIADKIKSRTRTRSSKRGDAANSPKVESKETVSKAEKERAGKSTVKTADTVSSDAAPKDVSKSDSDRRLKDATAGEPSTSGDAVNADDEVNGGSDASTADVGALPTSSDPEPVILQGAEKKESSAVEDIVLVGEPAAAIDDYPCADTPNSAAPSLGVKHKTVIGERTAGNVTVDVAITIDASIDVCCGYLSTISSRDDQGTRAKWVDVDSNATSSEDLRRNCALRVFYGEGAVGGIVITGEPGAIVTGKYEVLLGSSDSRHAAVVMTGNGAIEASRAIEVNLDDSEETGATEPYDPRKFTVVLDRCPTNLVQISIVEHTVAQQQECVASEAVSSDADVDDSAGEDDVPQSTEMADAVESVDVAESADAAVEVENGSNVATAEVGSSDAAEHSQNEGVETEIDSPKSTEEQSAETDDNEVLLP